MIDQAIIMATGTASIWLSQSPCVDTRRWAPIIGLCGQPAWMWMAYNAAQWGVLAMSVIYAIGWSRGILTYWMKP